MRYVPQVNEVLRCVHQNAGKAGAAIGAGVASGFFDDYESGIGAMTRPKATFTPDPRLKAHYDRRYRLYRELSENLRGFWAALQGSNGNIGGA